MDISELVPGIYDLVYLSKGYGFPICQVGNYRHLLVLAVPVYLCLFPWGEVNSFNVGQSISP